MCPCYHIHHTDCFHSEFKTGVQMGLESEQKEVIKYDILWRISIISSHIVVFFLLPSYYLFMMCVITHLVNLF